MITVVALILTKYIFEIQQIRVSSKYGLLIGILMIPISKEKIENKPDIQLRMQSYSNAFIMETIISLLALFADYVL